MAYQFDNLNNANNVGSALAATLNSSTGPTGTISVVDASPFSAITLPFLAVIGQANETDPSTAEVEVFRIDAVNTGPNTLHFSARSLDGTPAHTWIPTSIINVKTTGLYIEELQTAVNDLAGMSDAAQVYAYLNFSNKYR